MNFEDIKQERQNIQKHVIAFVKEKHLSPPLAFEELQEYAVEIIEKYGLSSKSHDLVAVYLNNELWRPILSTIPYERRILILPQCLADSEVCSAETDIYGLICEKCGNCSICSLQTQAELLGITALVAEGGTVVAGLIETGQVDAVIGVSCLDALEKIFPYMVKHAVPGIAIPLLTDGCKDTAVDVETVNAAFSCYEPSGIRQLQPKDIEKQVQEWFSLENLRDVIKSPDLSDSVVVDTAIDWVAQNGKRWRPCLAASAYVAISTSSFTNNLQYIAVAVECFHKASLIHDDIEDDDRVRYNQQTLHERIGVPAALNIGDFLIGEGYNLIASLDIDESIKSAMTKVAADGHRTLCVGQGEELEWIINPTELTVEKVINIFKKKTAPAFEVALSLGVLYAGESIDLCEHLKDFSNAFGIAYQIKDDIEDFYLEKSGDLQSLRPSLLLAIACEKSDENIIEVLRRDNSSSNISRYVDLDFVRNKSFQFYEHYKNQVIRSLKPIKNTELKRLLFRLSGTILVDIE
jgi:geranylgeranyl diphosphate synthase, type II